MHRNLIRFLSIAFATYAVVAGILSFLGWWAGPPRLIDWLGTGITIKANTALCALLAGGALLLLQAPAWPRAVQVVAVIPGLVGAATLLEHIFEVDLGIDQLFFQEPPGSPATASPGRMGPPAAASFVLLAVATWLVASGSRSRLSIALPLTVLLTTCLSLVGYAYGAEAMYTAPRLTGIAVQTATMLAALAIAVLLAQPDRQPMQTLFGAGTGSELARRLLPLAIAVPVLMGWLRIAGQKAGLFDHAFGAALRTSCEIVLFTAALWWAIQLARQREVQQRLTDRRKDEFLATLAHELRNPLAPIRMAAALSKKPQVSEEQRRWCNDVIERQVRHMSLLLDDLLDVSRITRGALDLRRRPTPVAEFVASALETVQPMMESRRHQLTLDVPAQDAIVVVDPLRIAQVISNLLNNAAKYTAEGGQLRLSVRLAADQLVIEVADNGIGIASADLDDIFTMFAQVKSAHAMSGGGLGIGLALTRGLVELHGGTLAVHSDGAGHGSTFTATLPGVLAALAPATDLSPPVRYTDQPQPAAAD